MENNFITIFPDQNVKYEEGSTIFFDWVDCTGHKLLINKGIQFNILSTYFDEDGNPDLNLFHISIETYFRDILVDSFSNLVCITY